VIQQRAKSQSKKIQMATPKVGKPKVSPEARAELLALESDHRIGSSLQLLADVLHRRSRDAQPKVRDELNDVAQRIGVIGKLHKHLSLPGMSGTIPLDAYLRSIGDDLSLALVDSSRTLLINVDDLVMPAGEARLMGLIVHELVVNALKHAFNGGDGIVQIACGSNREGGVTLEVTDDGARSEGRPATSKRGFGTTVVANLVAQLGGVMAVEDTRPGLRCTITIPAHG
jgi:two-component sensor histidine kinase